MSNAQIQAQLLSWIGQLLAKTERPFVLGVAGGQGVGKSYLTHGLLSEQFSDCIVLSLDDYYLTKAERAVLAQQVHPNLATRGVPGTHDLDMLASHIVHLQAGNGDQLMVPKFDKLTDDRIGLEQMSNGAPSMIVVEGWCLGAQPQQVKALAGPINQLEAQSDPDGVWRHYVNDKLAEMDKKLGALFDATMFLKPVNFQSVRGWRLEQERSNYAAQRKSMPATRAGEIDAFIQYYQRISEQMIAHHTHFDFVVEVSGAERDWKYLIPSS